ncbi:unannotated protein [freshwater metagenome]|uniref:Unannotated protein n=1 Tax=freshwater metagenome TaxID=449393 RepID=A0A6J6FAC8_9ZZZZ|nr:bifunctional nuclease family protein [Actinomycetota bacterium]MSX28593.1 bifunctional nuclease family protein [Actinomycetota bacterium]MSY20773.1 bifunctional nuclease family protein [Actinomycetota bacterium]MSY40272.1 bifunctional nuclease family protein [Actinomycetota bacterium]MSZ85233.1 bifunctional nuclease family protein [Actinomycetota bacterium]
MIALEVVGVRVEMPSNQPIVLLKHIDGTQFLPIWVGAVEATAIAFAQQGVEPPRPLTHDLMKDLLDGLGGILSAVHITKVEEGIFHANLIIHNEEGRKIEISARPSDAIALALRTDTAIWTTQELMDEAGIDIPEPGPTVANEEVEKFKEFLDQINPEDFLS